MLDEILKTGKYWIDKDYFNYINGIDVKELPDTTGNKQYKIGIIVPNYNNEQWLRKSLGSITSQRYKNYEIVFIDDMSTDNSVKIAKEYTDKVIELKQKRYNGGARNEGYLHLSEDVDYVYYVDSDDWLIDSNVLARINANLQGNPDVLFVGVGADINGIVTSFTIPKYNDRYQAILGWSGCYGMVVKKELATKQECLFPEGTLKEDRTQHYRVCINMKSYKCLQEIVYIWNRNNTNSVTTIRNIKWKADTIRNLADSVEMYETYKGQDNKLDQILLTRISNCKQEIENKGDSQQ